MHYTTFCILLDSSPAFDSMDFNAFLMDRLNARTDIKDTAAVWFHLISFRTNAACFIPLSSALGHVIFSVVSFYECAETSLVIQRLHENTGQFKLVSLQYCDKVYSDALWLHLLIGYF